jgi:hypothetical protein
LTGLAIWSSMPEARQRSRTPPWLPPSWRQSPYLPSGRVAVRFRH